MKRKINYLGEKVAFQPKLNFDKPKFDREKLAGLPPIGRTDEEVRRIVNECETGKLGLDFEGSMETMIASITGVSTNKACAAAKYNERTLKLIAEKAERGVKLVGHYVLGADKPMMENMLGRKTPREWWYDTMLKHWLVSADFCKIEKGGKKEDGDDGALGFMSLWSMMALYTNMWMYKQCEGERCQGVICPVHDCEGYCAVDSWGGLECDDQIDKRIEHWKIPQSVVDELHEFSELCLDMEKHGVRVSRERIKQLDTDMEEAKQLLFKKNDDGDYIEFNPRSSVQGLKWFAERGITLKSFSKDDVKYQLEKSAAKAGFFGDTFADVVEEMEQGDLSPELDALLRTYQYKSSGKGVKSWFDDRYIKEDNIIHARFIPTGTSTGRLSSSRPNLTNIPARGWGEVIKSCIIPTEPDYQIIDTDYSQLELRYVFWRAGLDPSVMGKDAFNWLLAETNGQFENAARENGLGEPRQLVKTALHSVHYGQGMLLKKPSELMTPTFKSMIEAGAVKPYLKRYGAPFDWEYENHIVCFSGASLAQKMFKKKDYPSCKKALDIIEGIYFKKFPELRVWQKNVLDFVQDNGYIRSQTGRILRLYGNIEDNAKAGLAYDGQGGSSEYVQGQMLMFRRLDGRLPLIQVHDSLVYEVLKSMTPKKIKDWMQPMFEENWRLPGFSCPGKIKVGPNYGQLVEI